MPDEPTSMQAQSNLGEAQDSVHKARRAVHQALSNTTETAVLQAENALLKAQNAVSAIADRRMQPAVEEIRNELASVQDQFNQVRFQRPTNG
ncbi:hypothetical protein [Alicyclobacillus mengziensis]|uniref:DUF2564 family protein n=1 Tax=Alicyclobacillus mengziensis TaxID=2931921 RepID=A0A9X7VWM8_9BACL|nr:hypothetical protein [Alicyclobacillus mengziensis]QSO46389.1 hypothetical protein JZ786_18155 [Alicyclobacillus mengziensis]